VLPDIEDGISIVDNERVPSVLAMIMVSVVVLNDAVVSSGRTKISFSLVAPSAIIG